MGSLGEFMEMEKMRKAIERIAAALEKIEEHLKDIPNHQNQER